MESSFESTLEDICENSAPGVAVGILDKFRYHFEDLERGQTAIERISRDHLERFSLLVPIKNLDVSLDTIFWGVISKYSRVDEEGGGESRAYKYVDPLFSIKIVIQPSMLEVVDIEKIEALPERRTSRLASFRRELEDVFLDAQTLDFVRGGAGGDGSGTRERERGGCFDKLDFRDFKVPLRRTVVYDSELLPKISPGDGREVLVIVRASANLKHCASKTGSWHSEWRFEFPGDDDSQGHLVWNGSVHMHSYSSESGNSHLVYKKDRVAVDVASGRYSSSELIKDPSLFARQTSAMISEKERAIQSRLSETVSQFKSKYVRKLRRILPINPVKFDWGRSCSSLQDPLGESILTSANFGS